MELSQFGEKFTVNSGILELMHDLGQAMAGNGEKCMLGGGNPAHIKEINNIWRSQMEKLLGEHDSFDKMLANYDTPKGREDFIDALASLLKRELHWDLGPENIAISNGSQSAFFILLNMFSGRYPDGSIRKVLFPVNPEYIGYADQGIYESSFVSRKPKIELIDDHFFKYHIDFDSLTLSDDISAVCVSRPTNPTGNVITDEELKKLDRLCVQRNIPLIIDNAYGAPFPQIIFADVNPMWEEHIIYTMSLSKLGLPSTRTGIIIACKEVIEAISACNAIFSLSNTSIGQVITKPLIESGEILDISRNIIRPYYQEKSNRAIQYILESFAERFPFRIHLSEGAIFLWIWFQNFPGTSKELYSRCKEQNVIIVPGEYFFYGLPECWEHSHECIRITYSQDDEKMREGIGIIADIAEDFYRKRQQY